MRGKDKAMKKLQKHTLNGEIIFLLLLFGMFAGSALATVMFGARAFEKIEENMDASYTKRMAPAYMIEKIRQHDEQGMIEFGTVDGKDALILKKEQNGKVYHTYIYEEGGYLRELFLKAGKEPALPYGEKIIEADGFSIEKEKGVYRLTIKEDGQETSCYVHPKTERAGED